MIWRKERLWKERERVVEREISGDLRPTTMDAAKLEQLKLFISRCQSDPSILSDPSLSFFRDYLESLGAKLPASAYKTESQSVAVPILINCVKLHVAVPVLSEDFMEIPEAPDCSVLFYWIPYRTRNPSVLQQLTPLCIIQTGFQHISIQRLNSHRCTNYQSDVPKGRLVVYVGENQKRRFVILISLLEQPLFQDMLRQSEEEFGFDHPMGGLTISCQEDAFFQLTAILHSL